MFPQSKRCMRMNHFHQLTANQSFCIKIMNSGSRLPSAWKTIMLSFPFFLVTSFNIESQTCCPFYNSHWKIQVTHWHLLRISLAYDFESGAPCLCKHKQEKISDLSTHQITGGCEMKTACDDQLLSISYYCIKVNIVTNEITKGHLDEIIQDGRSRAS